MGVEKLGNMQTLCISLNHCKYLYQLNSTLHKTQKNVYENKP